MKRLIQITFFSILCLFFISLEVISLGALGEDYVNLANILNHIATKALIIIFIYTALKLPIIFLLKAALINSCLALLSWKAIVKPDYLKELFTFRRKEVYYTQRKSLAYEIKKLIPLLNKNIGDEGKIRFCMNPISIVISLINCFKEYLVISIDALANNLNTYLRKYGFTVTDTINTNVSPKIFRIAKGLIVLICELTTLLLKFIQPIANLPYLAIYFIAITAPDYLMNLLDSNKHKSGINSVNVLNNNFTQSKTRVIPGQNIQYIKKQLELEDLDSISF